MKRNQGPSPDQEEANRQRELNRQREKERLQKETELKRIRDEKKEKIGEKAKIALKKRNQKGLWEQYQYHIIFGILGALVLFVIFAKAPAESRKPHEIQVIEEDFIGKINSQKRPYSIDANTFFEGWNLQDVKGILKNGFTKKKSVPRCNVAKNELALDKYNFAELHPNCASDVQNQGNCSSSFAFAAVGMFNDRTCLANNDVKTFRASPQHPLACDKASSKGCQGGYLLGALDLGRVAGFVDSDCYPYDPEKADDCETDLISKCKRNFVTDYCVLEGVSEIKSQISAQGPVAALMTVTREFLLYRDGIYDESFSDYKLEGTQAVKIVGWGADDEGQEYWIIENSWGASWGQDGFAHIKMNVIDSSLDKFAVGCTTNAQRQTEQPSQ
jgi:cathepsin B